MMMVAIACYTGYNQEDSIVMNRTSMQRGMCVSTTLKKYSDTITKNTATGQDDVFMKPDRNKVTGMMDLNFYNKLNDKGYVPEETVINNGDVIIGKVSPIQAGSTTNKLYKDESEIYKSTVQGTVDKVYTGIYNSDGYEMYNMRIRSERNPMIGDKLCSRHGQKGTIGILLHSTDMPFTESGIQPDIIINPCCFTGDTLVTLSDKTQKRIDSLNVSDKVMSMNLSTNQFIESNVIAFIDQGIKDVYKLTFDHGIVIKCTSDHKFWSLNRWIEAKEIKLNKDKFVKYIDGKTTNVKLISYEYLGKDNVYDIGVDHLDHTFFAENILVHNCIPSRMTIGQLFECVFSKVAALRGEMIDATPFNNFDFTKITTELKDYGFDEYGYEHLYCGMTGKKILAKIFIGPTFYLRLKHMVQDKIHSRATGPRQRLTLQPPEGRSKDGGLRFGEMERDAMISHGCSLFLKERLVDTSDIYTCYVCNKCGLIASKQMNKDIYVCHSCYKLPENQGEIIYANKIQIPYAFKLLVSELMAINILPRIRVRDDNYTNNL
jgi:DNA-directed RNA polymerase II subunit RPB2